MVNGGRNKRKGSSGENPKRSSADPDSCGRCGQPQSSGGNGASDKSSVPQKPRKTSKDSSGSCEPNSKVTAQKSPKSEENKATHQLHGNKTQNHEDHCPRKPHKSHATQTDFDKEVQCDFTAPEGRGSGQQKENIQVEHAVAPQNFIQPVHNVSTEAQEMPTQTEKTLRELCDVQSKGMGAAQTHVQTTTSELRSPSGQANTNPIPSIQTQPRSALSAVPPSEFSANQKPGPSTKPPSTSAVSTGSHLRCCSDKNQKNCVECTPFNAQEHPLMLRYKAIIVDAKPTLQQIRAKINDESCQAPPSAPPSVAPTISKAPTVYSVKDDPPVDEVDQAFSELVCGNLPIVWIFGLTPVAAKTNKTRCLQAISQKNSLGIIELDEELDKFNEATTPSTLSSKEPKGLNNQINYRGKQLANKVVKNKAPLKVEEICQLIKIATLLRKQNNPELHGFILNCFPLNLEEAVAMEDNVIKCVCGLYFLPIKWSSDKSVEPAVIPLRYNFRMRSYSERETEAAADYFGFKTIKILNSEDLEHIQINDINALVKKHIEGNGLELHRVMRQVEDGKTVGPSYVLMDHHDFLTDASYYSSQAVSSSYPTNESHGVPRSTATKAVSSSYPTNESHGVPRSTATKAASDHPTENIDVLYHGTKSVGVSSAFASEPVESHQAHSSGANEKSVQSMWDNPW